MKYDRDNRFMTRVVKDQLNAGKLIPWYYQEYGKVRVLELFILDKPVTKSKRQLQKPTPDDIEMYERAECPIIKARNDMDFLYQESSDDNNELIETPIRAQQTILPSLRSLEV